MNAPDPAIPRPSADPALRDALLELVGLGVRIARVAAEMAEVEGRVVAAVAAGLPASVDDAGSLAETQAAGMAVDAAEQALAQGAPRVASAAQAFDRVSRAVRRTVALVRRLECGWPRRAGPDDRQAMARRQIARELGDRITRHAEGEAAERLFDDLAERLETLELEGGLEQPVEAVVAAICRDLGLPPDAVPDPPAPGPAPSAADPPDG